MHTPDGILMYPVAHIRSDFPTKFGIPKQSGLSQALEAQVVFCPEYRSADAVRGLEEFSHIWLLWQFSAAVREGETFSPTVRPPRLGGNKRVGVFASRSPFRPNHIGLSCVKLERIEYTGEGPVLIVRGADLMDGTPILDVKPYLPYADSRPDAAGGFTDAISARVLRAEIPEELLRRVPEEKREGLYAFIRAQAAQGRQTYVVCPLVGEAELDDAALRSAAQEQKELAQALAPLKVGLVHGRMNKAQKEDTLAAFYAGTLDVLVATTVIEVGVNVPNATVMVIEGAERFGLAQLHQLRGRVGRGAQESWCFLMAEPNERLKTLVSTNDGFVVAQKDLELRGAGEFFGTRQHGEPQMPALMLTGDVRLLERTRQTFLQISRQAAYRDEYRAVLEAANRRFARSGQFLARN